MLWHHWLNEPQLTQIKYRQKSVEVISHSGHFSDLKIGDYIVWFNDVGRCDTIVTKVNHYSNLTEYYRAHIADYISNQPDQAIAEIHFTVTDCTNYGDYTEIVDIDL